jgi:streptogramin lyase
VIRVDPATGNQDVVTTGDHLSRALGLAYDGATGTIYVADTNADEIVRVDPSDGAQTPVASGFGVPRAIAIEAGGTLLVTDGSVLYRVDPSDGSKDFVGNQMDGLSELVIDPNGDLLVAAAGSFGPIYGNDAAVLSYDLPGGATNPIVSGSPFIDAQGIALWSNYIVVADPSAGHLYTIDPNQAPPADAFELIASNAVSLAVGLDDCLYMLGQDSAISKLCGNATTPDPVASGDLLPNSERIAIVPEPGCLEDEVAMLAGLVAPIALGQRSRRSSGSR